MSRERDGVGFGRKSDFFQNDFFSMVCTVSDFWARGYSVSTVGLDEEIVRSYIKNQENEDDRLEQLNLDCEAPSDQDPPPSGGS